MWCVATAIAVICIFCHFAATWKVQARVIESDKILVTLNEALGLLYDYIPRTSIRDWKNGNVGLVERHDDVCIMMLDIDNALSLASEMEPVEFTDLLTDYFETIESCVCHFSCFKINVYGDTICFASGVGEYHSLDHVVEVKL